MDGLRRALAAALAVGAVFGACPRPALAQDKGDPRAEKLFTESAELYREGKFAEAAQRLEEAYAISPEPVLLYNLARAYEGMGQTERALSAYRRYLEADPGTRDRRSIETRIETLERQLEERRALEDKTRAAATRQRDGAVTPEPRAPSPLPWIVAGVGALGIGAGAVLGVMSQGKRDDAEDPAEAPSGQAAADLVGDAETLATGANVAFIAGGAVLLGGVVWGIVDVVGSASPAQAGRAPAPRVTVWMGMGKAGVRGAF
ncbi:MAG: tetratricopeptide repeat protein [Polyangiaceae bacterium]